MTIVDGIILCVTILSALLGLSRGFAKELSSLVAWICGGALTVAGMPFVKTVARRYIMNEMMADAAAVIALFIALFILFALFSSVLSGLIKHGVVGGLDRMLGFLFGAVRGAVVLFCFQLGISCFMTPDMYPEIVRSNRFVPYIIQGGETVLALAPSSLSDFIMEQRQKHQGQMPTVSDAVASLRNKATDDSDLRDEFGHLIENNVNEALDHADVSEALHPAAKAANQAASSAQAQAEELASLKPQATVDETVQTGANKKQEQALNQFFNAPGVDETAAEVSDLAPAA